MSGDPCFPLLKMFKYMPAEALNTKKIKKFANLLSVSCVYNKKRRSSLYRWGIYLFWGCISGVREMLFLVGIGVYPLLGISPIGEMKVWIVRDIL